MNRIRYYDVITYEDAFTCAVETCNCVVTPELVSAANWDVPSSLICLCTLAIAVNNGNDITGKLSAD